MASVLFNSCLDDWGRGLIDFDSDAFKCMFVTSAYVPDKDAHLKRSDITDEIAVAGGYVAGGFAIAASVTKDLVNDRLDVELEGPVIPGATITARGAVYYKARGGAASADELVCYIDFGADIASTADTFTVGASTIRLQN